MALPSSGQISISSSVHSASTQVSFETSQSGKASNYSLYRLSRGDFGSVDSYSGINQNSTSKPNRSGQHSLAEFHSYNHTQNGSCSGTSFTDVISGYSDKRWSYHRINVTGDAGNIVVITVVEPTSGGAPFGPFAGGYYYIFNTYPFDNIGNFLGTNALYYGTTQNNSTSSSTVTYRYTMTSSSEVIYIVAYAYDYESA